MRTLFFYTILENLFDVYEYFDIAVCNANAGKVRMSKKRTVFHAEYEKNLLCIHIIFYDNGNGISSAASVFCHSIIVFLLL